MARPRNTSTIQLPPRVKGFMPIGYYGSERSSIQLNIDEYEAIRLLDYEGLGQIDAASYMKISRPTLTRVYNRARKKIAAALTESRQILIEGGKTVFLGEWYQCSTCRNKFNNPHLREIIHCILCGSETINPIV